LGAELAQVIVAHVCVHATMTGARMAVPLLALHLGRGNVDAGLLVALFAITQIFLALPTGRFADRHGLKVPVRVAAAGVCTGTALAAIWPVFPVLCVSSLLVGGSLSVAWIAVQRHVGRAAQTPAQLKQVFGWVSVAPAISNFLGPLIAGLVIDYFGYRAAFAVLTVMPLAGLFLMRTAREMPHEPVPATAAQDGAAWKMLRDAGLRRLLLMNWFILACWDLHAFMVPVLGHERGLPASAIGSILGAFAISAAVVRLSLPVFAARLREWVLITGATVITGLLFVGYPFAASALAMGICSAAIGGSLGMVQPMVLSMLHQITPRHRHGEALALRVILLNVSSTVMPLVFGAVGGVLGASAVFWATGAVVTACSGLGFALKGVGDAHSHGGGPGH